MSKIKIKFFVLMVFHLWGISMYAMEMKQDNDDLESFQVHTSLPSMKNQLVPAREYISPEHTVIGRVSLNDGDAKIYDLNNKKLADLGIVDNLSFSPIDNYVAFTLVDKNYKPVSFNVADALTAEVLYRTTDGNVRSSRPVFKNSSNILFGIPLENKTSKPLIVRLTNKTIDYKILNITNALFFGAGANKELVVFNKTNTTVDIINYNGDIQKSIKAQAFPNGGESLKISRDGKAVAWASHLKVFCIADLEKQGQIAISSPNVRDLTFSSDNECLAVTDAQRISFFETGTGNVRYFFDYTNLKHFDSNKGLGFSKVSWNEKSLFIHFMLGTWIKTEAEKIKALIGVKDENQKETKSLE